jgi:hypothetical protein
MSIAAKSLSPSQRVIKTFETLTPRQIEAGLFLGQARHVLLRGGSRSGKTFKIVRAVLIRAMKAPGSRHGIFRFRFNALRASIWLDTLPKVIRTCFPGLKIKSNRQDGFVSLPNGSEIWFCGLDDAERVEKILGLEFATIYFNECSQIPYSSVLVALTRLAQKTTLVNRAWYDCNPPGLSHWTHDLFKKKLKPGTKEPLPDPEQYIEMMINPGDNRNNLDPEYLASLEALPERQKKRFLFGEWTPDVEGALWSMEDLDASRLTEAPPLNRIVVGIDPPASSKDTSDECGIVVAGSEGQGAARRLYVLDDQSERMLAPERWARKAVMAYHKHMASKIVAEGNNGGEMVAAVIRNIDPNVPVTIVHATRGKYVRAEPIAAIYSQGRAHHIGAFPILEDQMCQFTIDGMADGSSPDRLDALVWAATDLMRGGGGIGVA